MRHVLRNLVAIRGALRPGSRPKEDDMLGIRMPGARPPQVWGVRQRMKPNVLLLAVFAFLLVSFRPSVLRAQATGEITGRVTDPTGAVVPNRTFAVEGLGEV